jgi:hypothetical protein
MNQQIGGLVATAFMAALMAAADARAQVTYISVDKSRTYDQTSSTNVVPRPARSPCNFNCGFAFGARVGGPSPSGINPPTVTGPIDSAALGSVWRGGVMGFNAPGNEWELFYPPGGEWNSPTQADIDAKFANGVYTITVQGQAYALNLAGDAYPAAPVMTVNGTGEWVDGEFVFDPRARLTITTSNSGLAPGDGLAGLYGCIPGGTCFHAQNPNPYTAGIFSFEPNQFADGEQPFFVATVTKFVDQVFGPGGTPNSWAAYNARTQLNMKAGVPQRFPLTVSANITPTVANATATFQPRPQDVGTSASVFVFALAPATKVVNVAKAKEVGLGIFARTAAGEERVPCVLAQLNAAGQLQAVSAANLSAYVTSTLSASAQTIPLLSSIPTPNIAGSTFYVGYGVNGTQMIINGVNQQALRVAGDVACDPQPPKTGWWWKSDEPGRGYSIEVAGSHIFFAAYLYDVSGRATWTIASGNTSLDGALFSGRLENYAGGQTLGGTPRAPAPVTYGEAITLAFSDGAHGTLTWPGGSIAIERFDIVTGGAAMTPRPNQSESGWWWNPAESGRGFFLEWQGGQLFIAGYMYDDAGNPIWYLTQDVTPDLSLQSFSGNWWQFANGPTLTGPFRQASRLNDNVAPVTIEFSGPETGIMTLPGGRTTAIRRFRF